MALSNVFHSINSPCLIGPFTYIYLFMKVSLSPDIILCGWLGLKHQLPVITLCVNSPCHHLTSQVTLLSPYRCQPSLSLAHRNQLLLPSPHKCQLLMSSPYRSIYSFVTIQVSALPVISSQESTPSVINAQVSTPPVITLQVNLPFCHHTGGSPPCHQFTVINSLCSSTHNCELPEVATLQKIWVS